MSKGAIDPVPARRRLLHERLQWHLGFAIVGACAGGPIVHTLLGMWLFPGPTWSMGSFVLRLAIVGVGVGAIAYPAVRWVRARRRAQTLGGRVCPCCEYELGIGGKGAEDEVVLCPECGVRMSFGELGAYWRQK